MWDTTALDLSSFGAKGRGPRNPTSGAKCALRPGFPIRGTTHGRVCGFLRRNKFSIKPRLVFGTAGSTTKRRVPHPLRFLQRVRCATVGIEIRGIPPFAKNAKDPGFPTARPQPWQRVRLSIRKAAWGSLTPPSLTGNPGGWGTRRLVALSAEDKKCPVYIPPRVGNGTPRSVVGTGLRVGP
jgi:hypothetical protein